MFQRVSSTSVNTRPFAWVIAKEGPFTCTDRVCIRQILREPLKLGERCWWAPASIRLNVFGASGLRRLVLSSISS